MMPPVFIIDDDAAVRDSLQQLFRSEGMQARSFESGTDFIDRLPDDAMACVVIDLRMPGLDGAEVTRRVMALRGEAWPVVVITAHADVPVAVGMMKAGVVDFIEKPFDPARLVETVATCLRRLVGDDAERQARAETAERLARLTPRESQVFDGLIQGRSNKEIAQILEISPRTVEVFRAKIMAKTEADSLSALVRMGLLAGVGDPGQGAGH